MNAATARRPSATLPRVAGPLDFAHEPVRRWFEGSFAAPTPAQTKGWASIATGRSTLLLAPTGSGKTLAAFLAALDKLMFPDAPAPGRARVMTLGEAPAAPTAVAEPPPERRLRVLYVSPLKALGVDVERNLAAPLAGIRATAERLGVPYRLPTIAVRSGDTPQAERTRIVKHPPDILITTPESLYLLLTSGAREILRAVETVIIDEIHSMVPTKRGAHLFLSLERLEAGRARGLPPLQRIGLSATQRPLEEVARLLGGGTVDTRGQWRARPVDIVDAGAKRDLDLKVEVPIDEMGHLRDVEPDDDLPTGSAAAIAMTRSIWPAIHPRLVELIRAHRTTMIFVNSRRLAERLAGAINELAGEELALAHHGSIAKDARQNIEERLKRGLLPAIVATSSLELGLDIGSVDLVLQVESPPSVASGLQRVGRANHQVGAKPKGVFFPKFRGDLLATATATARMHAGLVEETYYPRNPLDVLAQQVCAIVSVEPTTAEELYTLVRQASPFAELPRASFDGVLDMLSGRYPSDEFAELRPRITWDRVSGTIEARSNARRIAVINGGTIPDRGLYGVFLPESDDQGRSRRVGELDEEMVFESRIGEVFLLGASSWRIEDITHDRVVVVPAPGEPGKMPFWKGDRPGRPPELGRAIGALTRKLRELPRAAAEDLLTTEHGLETRATTTLLDYLDEQHEAVQEIPSDRVLVLERFVDEIGDWRVCLMTPYGARVHAPWAIAIRARFRQESDAEIDVTWSDDGIVLRLPEADAPPDAALFFPRPDEAEERVVAELDQTSLFGARFRENAGRALLFPKRDPQRRMPLWALRKRAANLLAVASKYSTFPIVLETYRECLRDVFDVPAFLELLRDIESRRVRVAVVDSKSASPFAASLLFNFVANFMYEGDGPIAERRAQALALDHTQLRQLLGEAELRQLLDAGIIVAYEARLQRSDGKYPLKGADALHDLLLHLGELSRAEVELRAEPGAPWAEWVQHLLDKRRILEVRVAGEPRLIAAEDMGKYRDALGIVPPGGVPHAFLDYLPDPLGSLLSRYARTHGPFLAEAAAARYGLGIAPVRDALARLAAADKVVEGEFLPGGRAQEWCDVEVLRALKRQSLAKLKKQVEPVEGTALARFLPEWQGLTKPRRGVDALLSVIEQLQGVPIPASVLESEVLPARIEDYEPAFLDELCAAGEVVWRGLEPLGTDDGRVALYLTDHYARLAPPPGEVSDARAVALEAALRERGAQFFAELSSRVGGFPQDNLQWLWALVWAGRVTNDTLVPLRSLLRGSDAPSRKDRVMSRGFRSRRTAPPGSEGRWSVLAPSLTPPSETERRTARALQLLERYGVLTREAVQQETSFGDVYPILKAMEEAGRVRRGYFVAGLGATQFALPGAEDRLRGHRDTADEDSPPLVLAATDPASPFGAALPWPERTSGEGARPQRATGAQVVLHAGRLLGWVGRTSKSVLTFVAEEEPERSRQAELLAGALAALVDDGSKRALLITQVDGLQPAQSVLGPYLGEQGFRASSKGYLKRRGAESHARR